jgi:hypothetical protein
VAKRMVGVTRFLSLCAGLLMLPAITAAQPPAPADLTVGAVSTPAILVKWSDRSTNEMGFEVFNGNEVRRVSADETEYVWGGMTPSEYMCFRVRSFNSSGFSPWVPADTPYYRCAVTPRSPAELLAFPISGDSNLGSYGLHDDNFGSVQDDTIHAVYRFNNSGPGPGFTSSRDFISEGKASVYSVRAGTGLAAWDQCEVVVVESGDLKNEADCEPGGRQMSKSKDAREAFGIRIGPFGIDITSPGQVITQTQTETSHRLQIRIDPAVTKETIKARLVSPGLLEIEWPRVKGEEIPIE